MRATVSLPARGVWIEIIGMNSMEWRTVRHSPQGECGLKYAKDEHGRYKLCHSPQGECGLKFQTEDCPVNLDDVTPRKGSVD